ncbi:hypothetical protein PSTG_09526 [Puccinia striiformis f. sp. tritici PST-78]|uniref:DDE Tnp4 domain-containing protein n=1 Tax=Puccinia striiformis f. sp. tritici PST-78 TaxID=1165861 RepID=A0A0L0VDA2_9BASI|nr:hypothetical protein PSTG_09526 [Puccinia striiformis f. sp. tritici PST-78]
MPRISDRKILLNDLNSISPLLVIRLKLKKETIPPSILPYWTITTNIACAISKVDQSKKEKLICVWLFFFIIYLSKRISTDQFQPPLLQSKEAVQLLQFLGLVDELTHQRYLNPRMPRQRIASRDRTFNTLFSSRVEVFLRWARMTQDSFLVLLSMIESHPVFHNRSRNPQAPASHQLLVALAHFGLSGNGGAIAMLSEVFNVSEGSIENFTNRTLQAILDLEDRYVKWPTPQERIAMIDSLPEDDIFRNCVGFVDGTIIPLESAPTKNKEDYWMRKMLYAVNSLLVCDRNKRIIYSFHGWCGSAHDQRVYKNSRFLLADSAYTATDTVVPAFKRSGGFPLPKSKQDFNYQLSSRRVAIEQCIGILKNRWQSLKSSRLLIRGSTSAARLNVWLRVCVILHNFLRGQSTSNWVPFESNLPAEVPSLENDEDNLENSTLRDTLFRRFCDSNDH